MEKPTVVSHREAREIALRLISGSFRRDREKLPPASKPRLSVPMRADDDDMRLLSYIEQNEAAVRRFPFEGGRTELQEALHRAAAAEASLANLTECLHRRPATKDA
ncbi:hypothetical protein [Rhodomicrobium lacus]|uniref:hypothetical protein n=1 Tax=Rhodomicrobium lacus TaxID=2498452 RepID=UPI000F8D0BD6|nr:hypothetical protein [Rhodomicrobium lacus]